MKRYKEIKDGKVLRDDVIMDHVTLANHDSEGTGISYEPHGDEEETPEPPKVKKPAPKKK